MDLSSRAAPPQLLSTVLVVAAAIGIAASGIGSHALVSFFPLSSAVSASVNGGASSSGVITGFHLTRGRSPVNVAAGEAAYPTAQATSENWAGYVYCPAFDGEACPEPSSSSEIQGVQGSWTIPGVAATSSATEDLASWVGIGGFGTSDLVQAGFDEEPLPGLGVIYNAWWEMLPAYSTPVSLSPDATIHPGDQVSVSIEYSGFDSGGQVWHFEIWDISTNSSWSANELCGAGCTSSEFGSAEWIGESPEVGSTIVQLPAFSTWEFRGAQFYTNGSTWVNLQASDSPLFEVDLTNPTYIPGDTELASELYSDGSFYLEYLVDVAEGLAAGEWGSISTGVFEPNEAVTGSLNITSPDSFSSSVATNLGLSTDLELPGQEVCESSTSADLGFSIAVGSELYSVDGSVCAATANGVYFASVGLWYVPPGEPVGGPGSLLLISTGTASGALITVDGPVAGAITAVPTSSEVDVGQRANLSVNPHGGSLPYSFIWSGLPTGCQTSASAIDDCEASSPGDFAISVLVVDAFGDSSDSPTVMLVVLPHPLVNISNPGQDLLQGVSATFGAAVSGGLAPYSYHWTGLPPGCVQANQPVFTCAPSAYGSYSLGLQVTDSIGESAYSNATVVVTPAILGLSIYVVALIAALAAAVVLLVVIAARRGRHSRNSDNDPGTIAERVRNYSRQVGPSPVADATVSPDEVWKDRDEDQMGWQPPPPMTPDSLGAVRFEGGPFCTHCGTSNPKGALYCGRCAVPIHYLPGEVPGAPRN